MTITAKLLGNKTISVPKAIRDEFGFEEGVIFEVSANPESITFKILKKGDADANQIA
jgi:bifunctional DNA-binding transcriptional regulator/antitoxin component of YhaV-PrlF toxin-antitoxin module